MHVHLQSLVAALIDTCFPPSAEMLLVRSLTERDISSLYTPVYQNGIWSLSSYADTRIRALIHEAKFHRNKKAVRHLSTLLRRFLEEHAPYQSYIWIPIPLSGERLRSRGYNQTHEVLYTYAKTYPLTIETTIITRMRNTTPQTDLPRAARLTNMAHAFSVPHKETIEGKDLVIFDDVTTTGTTLNAAREAVANHNPRSVICVALAH